MTTPTDAASRFPTLLTMPSDLEIVVTRTFAAPRSLVFAAWTQPEHLRRWWVGPEGFTVIHCDTDSRPGGEWRIVQRDPQGGEHPFKGEYREVVPPARLAFTQIYDVEPWSGREVLVTVDLTEDRGLTTVTITTLHPTRESRDAQIQMGAERGMRNSLEQLATVLRAADLQAGVSGQEVVASRVVGAPRDLVFEVWTDPNHVAKWWGPDGFTITTEVMDVRPGGEWRFVMHGPDGMDYPNHIIFRALDAPEHLEYEHVSGPRFVMTIDFADLGGATRVTVRQRFATPRDLRVSMEKFGAIQGLNQTLDRMKAHAASRG